MMHGVYEGMFVVGGVGWLAAKGGTEWFTLVGLGIDEGGRAG